MIIFITKVLPLVNHTLNELHMDNKQITGEATQELIQTSLVMLL